MTTAGGGRQRTQASSVLEVEGLAARAGGREVLRGIDLTVRGGEVHAVMGPNGSGKSTLAHALMGRPGTTVTGGSVRLDGTDLLALASWRRARAGLFVALQQPIPVPGVRLAQLLSEATSDPGASPMPLPEPLPAVVERLEAEAASIGFDRRFLDRPLNVDLSGGERKRSEMVQLGTLRPRFAVLDEIDSGLDVDALAEVGRRIHSATGEWGMGAVVVTHFVRILRHVPADRVHVLVGGRLVASGGPELAEELERSGYGPFGALGAAAGPGGDSA